MGLKVEVKSEAVVEDSGKASRKGDKKEKKQQEHILYTNPMSFINIDHAHLHCNDETIKVTCVGKIPKDDGFVYKLDCLRISERALLSELRQTLLILYNTTVKPKIPVTIKDFKLIQA